jgi:hypothetical protein
MADERCRVRIRILAAFLTHLGSHELGPEGDDKE